MKKISLIGDSITEHTWRAKVNWTMYLKEDYEVQNLGISGTGFYRNDPYINRIEKIEKDTDLIGIAVSFNDLNNEDGIETGNINKLSEETLLRYANEFIEKLLLEFPCTPIIAYIQNPWNDYRLGIEKSDIFVEQLEKLFSMKGVPFYTDLYYKGSALRPWIKENCEKYFVSDNPEMGEVGVVDNVHPNSEGHKLIYKYIKNKIDENIID